MGAVLEEGAEQLGGADGEAAVAALAEAMAAGGALEGEEADQLCELRGRMCGFGEPMKARWLGSCPGTHLPTRTKWGMRAQGLPSMSCRWHTPPQGIDQRRPPTNRFHHGGALQ